MIKMDGYDDCIVGITHKFGSESSIAYDLQKVLFKLQKDGMTEEEALEFWEFNMLGSYVGEPGVIFIDTLYDCFEA